MRSMIFLAMFAASVASTSVMAGGAPAHYTVEDTDLGTILDNPAAAAIVDKYVPNFSKGDQIQLARPMTLKALQSFASDTLTDKVLGEIDADFAKLPVTK